VNQSFTSTQRLRTAHDYKRVFSAPDYRVGQREVLLIARYSDGPQHRLGLAIAKKHVPTAVKRNLIKRLTREQFRSLPQDSRSLDIVVLTRPGANDTNRCDLRKAIRNQFRRLLKAADDKPAIRADEKAV
jgi:ribonuclease P protein component